MSVLAERKEFFLDEYINKKLGIKENKVISISKDNNARFINLCDAIKEYFQNNWEETENLEKILERQKKAIIGYESEVSFFKDNIQEYLKNNNLTDAWFPSWYDNLIDAIYHENWGLAGLAAWKNYPESSSAKIIGERIYFLIDGKVTLQPQRISLERFKQLRKALLLNDPKKRLDQEYSEVYMLDGTRIAIYDEGLAKDTQPSIVFRRYIIPEYTFEEQVKRGTIPEDIIPMFKSMIKIGFNVAFVGAVRTSKTTFLQTWQSYENPSLEGLMIETDPEIPLHKLMSDAPIMQLVADGDKLRELAPKLLRSDNDYMIVAEARDGVAFHIAVETTNKGTRRSKLTAHLTRAVDFPYAVAEMIVNEYGGSLYSTILKVAKNFNYVFEFIQLQDKSKKRLKSIYEISYNPLNHEVIFYQICKYRFETDDWIFSYNVSEDKEIIGVEENPEALKIFKEELKKLSEKYPLKENNVFVPAYDHLKRGM